jgi:hypothetical protein
MRARRRAFFAAARRAAVPLVAALWAALGTFWTIFAWYHQEVVVPSTAPVNLTTEVSLENVGSSDAVVQPGAQFDAIQLSVTANNVSSRNVYFLSNYWDAWGGKAEFQSKGDDNEWLRDVNRNEQLQAEPGQFRYPMSGKYYNISKFERVARGNIFPSAYFLYPKETVSASVVFYVPKGSYDLLHVEVHIPTTEKKNLLQLKFLVDEARMKPKYFKIDAQGKWNEVTAQADIDALPIQETQSRKQLSLWRNETPSAKSDSSKPASSAAPNP